MASYLGAVSYCHPRCAVAILWMVIAGAFFSSCPLTGATLSITPVSTLNIAEYYGATNVSTLALNEKGTRISLVLEDGRIVFWDVRAARALGSVIFPKSYGRVTRIVCTEFGALCLTDNDRLFSWSILDDKKIEEIVIPSTGEVPKECFDGEYLLQFAHNGSGNTTLYRHKNGTVTQVKRLDGVREWTRAYLDGTHSQVCFVLRGKIVLYSLDLAKQLWELQLDESFNAIDGWEIREIRFSPSGKHLVVATTDFTSFRNGFEVIATSDGSSSKYVENISGPMALSFLQKPESIVFVNRNGRIAVHPFEDVERMNVVGSDRAFGDVAFLYAESGSEYLGILQRRQTIEVVRLEQK